MARPHPLESSGEQASLPERFRPIRRIGEGGMGIVYEAIDRDRGARVAVKMMRATTPDALARFKREFRAVQALQHRNIVSLGELLSDGTSWLFTMELVEGVDVLSYVYGSASLDGAPIDVERAEAATEENALASDGAASAPTTIAAPAFDERRLRDVLRQLATALDALHGAGLVHRDIKPSNVRVTPEGRVVLLDFGLVADAEEAGALAAVVGTPHYMAPEQAVAPPGPAADWYGLGVVLYQALTGRVPFAESSAVAAIIRKQNEDPAPPRTYAPRVPRDLDALCVALLVRNAASRAGSAEVMRALSVAHPSRERPARSAFVGRAEELRALRLAFDEPRAGALAVIVSGESGIGKSHLLQRFVATLEHDEPRLLVLAGRCYEREELPYKAFDGVVDSLTRFLLGLTAREVLDLVPARADALANVFPVLRRVPHLARIERASGALRDPRENRARAFAALREILANLSRRNELVLVIDDVQWSDPDSATLLAEVLRPPDAPRLMLLATMRATTGAEAPSDTRAADRFVAALPCELRRAPLGRLDEGDARTLAAILLDETGDDARAVAEGIASESGGHPLFVDALVRHARAVGTRARIRLDDALWSRIEQLEPSPRALLELVAVAGAPLARAILIEAAGLDGGVFASATRALQHAQLVTTTGVRDDDTLDAAHARIRESAYAHLGDGARRRAHERIAVSLERRDTKDHERLAMHWRGADDGAGKSIARERWLRYTLLAADDASAALAFDRAAQLYSAVIDEPEMDRRAVLEKLGDALAHAGRGAQAAHAYRDAADGAEPQKSLELRRRAAEQLLRAGHFDEGLDAIGRVLATIGLRIPRTRRGTLVSLIFWRVVVALRGLGFARRDASSIPQRDLVRLDASWSLAFGLMLIDAIAGAAFQLRFLLLTLRAGEPVRVARAFALHAAQIALDGARAWPAANALFDRARTIADSTGDAHAIAWVKCAFGSARYIAGHYRAALVACDEAEEMLRDGCRGVAWELDSVQSFALWSLAQLGETEELRQRQARYVRDALDRGDLYGAALFRTGDACLGWLAAGAPQTARADLADAMKGWSKAGFHLEHFYELVAATHVDLYEGRGAEAYERIAREWPRLRASLLLRVESVRIQATALRARAAIAAALTTRDATLFDRATRDARALRREAPPHAKAMADLIEGGAIAARGGDRVRAASLAIRAAEAFTAASMSMCAAAAELAAQSTGEEERERPAWFRAQRIADPIAIVRCLAPGYAAR